MNLKNHSWLLIVVLFLLTPLLSVAQRAGSIDQNFNIGVGANGTVYSTILLPDGKILVGGNFTSINGISRIRLAILNPNGSLDTNFNRGSGANSSIRTMAIQSDGKILIGGTFTSYNGVSRNRIARLNTDGSLDATFNPGTGSNNEILTVALQPDGKILTGGFFSTFNGLSRNKITRLNADGSTDATFNPGTGANNTRLEYILVLPNGKIMISGNFSLFNGSVSNNIARLNADGSLDQTFNSRRGAPNGSIEIIVPLSDGKFLLAGPFIIYDGTTRNRIARINSDGSLDNTFNPGNGATGYNSSSIAKVVLQPDGKIIAIGWFNLFNNTNRNNIVRLNNDGSVDNTFNPGSGTNASILAISLQPDGKIIIGGIFSTFNGTNRNYITRLHGSECTPLTTPTISGNDTICIGGRTQLTSSSPTGNFWNTGDTSRSILVSNAGNYSVRVIANSCTSQISNDMRIVALTVPAIPIVSVNVNLLLPDSSFLTVLNPIPGLIYEWNNGMRGTRIVVGNADTLKVRALRSIQNCASEYSAPVIITNISNSIQKSAFDVFPNPSNGFFTIKSAKEGLKLQLINTLGAKVTEFVSQEGEHSLNLSHLPAGVYFLQSPGFTPLKVIKQ